jgi:hypothetical protein
MPVNAEFAATLRSQVREALANPPVAEPTQAAEATPAEAAPVVPDATATPAESTSPAEATPSPAPAESPSAAQPTPASDAPSPSAVEALQKRGFTVTDEKLATEYLRIESEFAAMKRAEKVATKTQPAETQPETQQTAPEQAPVSKPIVAPVTPQPAPPVAQPQAPAELEQVVTQLAAQDSTCVALIEDFRALDTDIQSLWKVDRHGRPVGGQIFDINAQIASLEQALSPNEHLKKAGVPLPELDPIQRQDMERVLLRFKLDRRDLIDAYNGKLATQTDVRAQYNERVQSIREPYERDAQTRAEAEQRDAEIETKAQTFEKTWTTAQATVFTKLAVPEKLKPAFAKELRRAALAQPGALESEQLSEFMESVVKDEQEKLDAYHREKAAEYAAQKRTDAQVATQAPSGQAAVATPSPSTHQDWQKALKQSVRAALS